MNESTIALIKNGALQAIVFAGVCLLVYADKLSGDVAVPILSVIAGAIFGANVPTKKG